MTRRNTGFPIDNGDITRYRYRSEEKTLLLVLQSGPQTTSG